MKQQSITSNDRAEFIRDVTVFGDFIWLNVVMLAVYYLLREFHPSAVTVFSLKMYMVLGNLCYVPCVSAFKVILHNRVVRPEQIIGRLLGTIGMHIALFLTALALVKVANFSRIYLISFYAVLIPTLTVWRLSLRQWVKVQRKKGKNARTVVLVGGTENIKELEEVMKDVTYGYRVEEMFFNDLKGTDFSDSAAYRSELDRLFRWLGENSVEELYCSLPSICRDDVLKIIRYCENNLVRFYSVPNVRNYVKRKLQLSMLGDVPVLSIRKEPLRNPLNRLAKRSLDVVCASLFLITIFPIVYVILGIMIKISSPGPVFFVQERNGVNGKVFKCYKFRSMKVNKDCNKVQATLDDPRKTKFGKFLRKSNLDELPQFINVLKGDMSLVGPRPHMQKHTEEYSQLVDKYMMRHLVKPGITGWAQVTGFRGETKELAQMEGRVKRDLWYIENWTFLLDLRILLMTVMNMFKGEENAY